MLYVQWHVDPCAQSAQEDEIVVGLGATNAMVQVRRRDADAQDSSLLVQCEQQGC